MSLVRARQNFHDTKAIWLYTRILFCIELFIAIGNVILG